MNKDTRRLLAGMFLWLVAYLVSPLNSGDYYGLMGWLVLMLIYAIKVIFAIAGMVLILKSIIDE